VPPANVHVLVESPIVTLPEPASVALVIVA
jgi:hypothetical protein